VKRKYLSYISFLTIITSSSSVFVDGSTTLIYFFKVFGKYMIDIAAYICSHVKIAAWTEHKILCSDTQNVQ